MATKKTAAPAKATAAARGAAATAEETAAAETQAKPRKRGKRRLVALSALLVATGLAGAAWHTGLLADAEALLAATPPAETPADAEKPATDGEAPPKPRARKPQLFVPVEPFTVNLQDDERERYLQVGLVIEASEAGAVEALKARMPLVRSQILLLLASKHGGELLPAAGKRALAEEIVKLVRAQLESELPERGVEQVHFSSFIIQ